MKAAITESGFESELVGEVWGFALGMLQSGW